MYRALGKLSSGHGPIFMLCVGSRITFLVSHPTSAAAMEECLTIRYITYHPLLLARKHLGYDYTTLSWSSYGDHWRNLRRVASLEPFSAHQLQTLNSIRSEEVRLLVKKVHERTAVETTMEMKSVFFELMLNVMMSMCHVACQVNIMPASNGAN